MKRGGREAKGQGGKGAKIIFEDKEILKIIFNNLHLNNPVLYMWQQLVVMFREFFKQH